MIELLNGHIPTDVKVLIDRGEINEEFNYSSPLKFIMRKENKLVGIIVYMMDEVGGVKMPRFIHAIMSLEFRGKTEPREFLRMTENELKKMGHNQVFSRIPNEKKYMHRSAIKHGYKLWHETPMSKFYYKDI